jgi:hypothetical protein
LIEALLSYRWNPLLSNPRTSSPEIVSPEFDLLLADSAHESMVSMKQFEFRSEQSERMHNTASRIEGD